MLEVLSVLAVLSTAPDGAAGARIATSSGAPTAPTAPTRPSDLSRPYASRILLADAVGWGLVLSSIALGSEGAAPFTYLGVASLTLAAPGVHAARGHPGRALGSFGLRFGGLLLGGLLGASSSGGDLGGFEAGSAVGLLAAELIDVSMLAGGSPDGADAPPPGGPAALMLVPVIAPWPGGGLLGVAARF